MPDTLPLLTLYLSDRCNSRCITCDYWKNGIRDIDLESVRRMLPDLDALQTRDILISGGEPLLNRQWREIAMMLKAHGFNLWLLTSGLSLAKHAAEIAGLFDSVTVSLDGANRETYQRIRGVDAFDKVCEGIEAVAQLGVPTSIRVTLQRANYRELIRFVPLARTLGAKQVSFLAVDVANQHAFARADTYAEGLVLDYDEVTELRALVDVLEVRHAGAFAERFIAESPARLRHICDYFAALQGAGDFPEVRCNAPEFSAVVGVDGQVSPCFFISGHPLAPRAPSLKAALDSSSMRELRAAIRGGARRECERCVCSMWRDPVTASAEGFSLRRIDNA